MTTHANAIRYPHMLWSTAQAHLALHDPTLATLIARIGACQLRPQPRERWFDTLCIAIVSQQISAKAAAVVGARLRALTVTGQRSHVESQHGFVQAGNLTGCGDDALRAVGLTRMKVLALRDLEARVLDGRLQFDVLALADDAQTIRLLDDVRGIGPWTAQMFAMFALGRSDILPLDDIGILRAMQRLYGLAERPDAAGVRAIAAHGQWSPYASVACWYLWAEVEPDGNPMW